MAQHTHAPDTIILLYASTLEYVAYDSGAAPYRFAYFHGLKPYRSARIYPRFQTKGYKISNGSYLPTLILNRDLYNAR